MRVKFLNTTAAMICVASVLCVGDVQAQETPSLAVSKANRTVAVTATERVTNMADAGVVHVGFVQYGPTKDAAYATGSQVSNAIMTALTDAGVPRGSIQSESQEISENQVMPPRPDMPVPAAEQRAKAFVVRQSWTVRVAANDAARVLNVAVNAGANQSGQIDWQLGDVNAAQAAAAAKAIQRAQTQAKAMAAGLGVHLGDLLYASNQVEGAPIRPMPMMLQMRKAAAPQALAINPREIETSATVYAVFALE